MGVRLGHMENALVGINYAIVYTNECILPMTPSHMKNALSGLHILHS